MVGFLENEGKQGSRGGSFGRKDKDASVPHRSSGMRKRKTRDKETTATEDRRRTGGNSSLSYIRVFLFSIIDRRASFLLQSTCDPYIRWRCVFSVSSRYRM